MDLDSDLKIYELFEEKGEDWCAISRMMGNMDPIKLRNRYYTHVFKKKQEIVEEIEARKKARLSKKNSFEG